MSLLLLFSLKLLWQICPSGEVHPGPDGARLYLRNDREVLALDAISLELLASNLAMWRKATRDVDALGQVVMSGGIAIANPAIAISERAQVQVRAMIAGLGISAAFKRKMAR